MTWSEKWRSADRPDPSEIPDEYGISANSTEKLMCYYFCGITVLSYVGIRFVGTRDLLVAGIPVLMWVIVIIAALVILGLYVIFSHNSGRDTIADVGNQTELDNE